MPRILILHALLGTGHRSAAQAIAAALGSFPGAEVAVEDSLDFINPGLNTLWQRGYKQLSERIPEVYSYFFKASDAEDARQAALENLRGARLGQGFFRKLTRYVEEQRPDAVICVMQVPLMLMSLLKQEGRLAAPLYCVVTDYVAHATWIVPGVERFFLPSELTAQLLAHGGLDPRRLQVTGIPVRPEIARPKPLAELRAKLDLPAAAPVLTIFGGGVDTQQVRAIVAELLAADLPLTLNVVAGRNAALATALADLKDGPHVRLRKLGMIDYVDDLVAASDLVISKPGGLITSEVLARGTPMIAIAPLPGQEDGNADFISLSGAGLQLRTAQLAPAAALQLLRQPERLREMRARAQAVGKAQAAQAIAAQVLADLGRAS